MENHFSEVLAQERAHLAGINDEVALARWRDHAVRQLMVNQSPYALALRPATDPPERADFLQRWRDLIAEAVARLRNCRAIEPANGSSAPAADDQDRRTAVLILAAILGGNTLSQVAGDPRPLNAALDMALARLGSAGDDRSETAGKR